MSRGTSNYGDTGTIGGSGARSPEEPVESDAYQRRGYVEVVIDGNR